MVKGEENKGNNDEEKLKSEYLMVPILRDALPAFPVTLTYLTMECCVLSCLFLPTSSSCVRYKAKLNELLHILPKPMA
jgi:hypothetical protein